MRILLIVILFILALLSFFSVSFFFLPGVGLFGLFLTLAVSLLLQNNQAVYKPIKLAVNALVIIFIALTIFFLNTYIKGDYQGSGLQKLFNPPKDPTNYVECLNAGGHRTDYKPFYSDCEFKGQIFNDKK